MVYCGQCCSRQADLDCTRRPPYCSSCCRYWSVAQPIDCALHQHIQPKKPRLSLPRPLARKSVRYPRVKAKEERKEEKQEEAHAAEEAEEAEDAEEEKEEEGEEVDTDISKLNTASQAVGSSSSSSSSDGGADRSSFPALAASSLPSVSTAAVAELVGALGPVLRDIQLTVNGIAQRLPPAASASSFSPSSAPAPAATSSRRHSSLAMTPPLADVKSMDQLLRALATLLRRTLFGHPGDSRLALAVHAFIVKSLLFAHSSSVSTAVRYLNECELASLQQPPQYDPVMGDVYLAAYQSIVRPRLSPAAAASLSDLLLTADDSDASVDERDSDADHSGKRRRTATY